MATTKLVSLLAAAGIAASLGCIQEECLDTYFLNEPTQVSIEPGFTERVRTIDLTMKARNNPWDYMGEHAYAENLNLRCAPNMSNDCVDGHEYEFFVNYITPDGQRFRMYSENNAGYNASVAVDTHLNPGAESGSIECIVWSPGCSTAGYTYVDEYGVEHFNETDWRPRTLVGAATAEIGMSAVCPAPLAPFKPVSEEDLQNALNQ